MSRTDVTPFAMNTGRRRAQLRQVHVGVQEARDEELARGVHDHAVRRPGAGGARAAGDATIRDLDDHASAQGPGRGVDDRDVPECDWPFRPSRLQEECSKEQKGNSLDHCPLFYSPASLESDSVRAIG